MQLSDVSYLGFQALKHLGVLLFRRRFTFRTPETECFLNIVESSFAGRSEPEFVVLSIADTFVVSAEIFYEICLEYDGTVSEGVLSDDISFNFLVSFGAVDGDSFPTVGIFIIASDDAEIPVILKKFDLFPQFLRMPPIIRVDSCRKRFIDICKAFIEGFRESDVFFISEEKKFLRSERRLPFLKP